MYGNGDVVTERMVVQNIDCEEEHNIDQPSANGHSIRLEKQRWPPQIDLRNVSGGRDEEKLYKCEQCP